MCCTDQSLYLVNMFLCTGSDRSSSRLQDPAEVQRRFILNSTRLRDFYRKHAPELVTSANKILGKFKGREAELFAKVAAKYNQPANDLVAA